ncbi:hypothetical protein [Maritalea mediterranea]|uniref:Uncharacterized protein n=1 Tax=Maritalea mediterranea TaxID=2909667 RepID=A0ABS9E8F6_9HYPH|nr:hypothetical protein [Maritalea mediterranea]MCF4099088.1 hypothetical protein [Maritalea mediterranea]
MFGTGIYRRGNQPGTLTAEWLDDRMVAAGTKAGTGFAKNGPANGFVGDYDITYVSGEQHVDLKLTIRAEGPNFRLAWYKNDTLIDQGIAFQSGDILILSYQSI